MQLFANAVNAAREADDLYLEGVTAHSQTLDPTCDLQFFEIHGSHFEHCSFCGANLGKASFYDCTFLGCDFSNVRMDNAFFARSRLEGCKLEGAQLTGAIFRSTRLVGCHCRYANMGEAKFEGAVLEECDLREAFLNEVRFAKRSRLNGCSLVRADFFRTPLKGMDLSTCDIAGIAVSDTRQELHGAIICAEQAVDVVGMLGLRVKE